MPSQPIPPNIATSLISEYKTFMTGHGVDMKSQTQSISFNGAALMHWLNASMPFADELKIFPGCYPAGFPSQGRTTVVLWPYKNGQPANDGSGNAIQPFNEGAGFP